MLDANDHSPVLSSRLYRGAVSEGAAPGAPIVRLLCRDGDHAPQRAPPRSMEAQADQVWHYVVIVD